jgi:hypothetical protein
MVPAGYINIRCIDGRYYRVSLSRKGGAMHCLKKLAASVLLQYDDGLTSRGLVGENFRIEFAPDGMILSVDLANNLEERNRGHYCYQDAQLFQSRHDRLRYFHLHDKGIGTALRGVSEYFRGLWQIELYAGGPFCYAAKLDVTPRGAVFAIDHLKWRDSQKYTVQQLLPTRAPV